MSGWRLNITSSLMPIHQCLKSLKSIEAVCCVGVRNFELGVLDECVAIAVTNSMCTDLPVVHYNYFPHFVDQSS